jgi:hypothetical protein
VNVPLHIKNVNAEGDGFYRSPTQQIHDDDEIMQSQEMFEVQNENVDNQGRVTRFMNLLINKKLLLNNNHPHPIINIFDIPTCTNIQI